MPQGLDVWSTESEVNGSLIYQSGVKAEALKLHTRSPGWEAWGPMMNLILSEVQHQNCQRKFAKDRVKLAR